MIIIYNRYNGHWSSRGKNTKESKDSQGLLNENILPQNEWDFERKSSMRIVKVHSYGEQIKKRKETKMAQNRRCKYMNISIYKNKVNG